MTFEPVISVPNPNGVARFESQLRPTPDGQTVHMAWNENTGIATNAMLSKGSTETIADPVAPVNSGSSDNDLFGLSFSWITAGLVALGLMLRRKRTS